MHQLSLPVILLLFVTCSSTPSHFTMTGTTDGLPDGTALYLTSTLDKTLIDSAVVTKNTFFFDKDLASTPLLAILATKDNAHYRFLWLENSAMTFDSRNTDFRHAMVTGSKTEDVYQSLLVRTDSLSRNERLSENIDFVREHPNSPVSAYLLSVYYSTWGKKTTSELFDNFTERNKNSPHGKSIAAYIQLNNEPALGDPFVDFSMENLNGEIHQLDNLKGKVILLEFWASWCGPCRQENPNLVRTYATFHPKGFEVFAVSLDDQRERWQEAVRQDSLPWMHVSDLNGVENKAALIYGVSGIPDNFLIDRDGKVIARNLRGEDLHSKLEELFN